jgi:5-hydroxyisourate hydrolase-like protein (transthyretin family)
MMPKHYLPTALKLLIILIIAAGFAVLWYIATMSERADAQQTILVGPTRLAPGSQAGLRVVVQEVGRGRPLANAAVKVSLQAQSGGPVEPLFEGVTDASGSLPLDFRVPDQAEGDYQLIVETESTAGSDRLERPIAVERDYRLLLTTDKPLYQPGQTIHMRALALSRLDLTPARQASVDFLVEDAKGNKVFRQSVLASDFGIAAADFTLANRVNQGDYKLSLSLGDTRSEKTVEVKPYVLPKFQLNLTTDRSFYTPGQRVEGSLQADYFFGKPVAGGQVRLVGSVYDVGRVELLDLAGQTDETGRFDFSFNLPDYFASGGLENQQAQFALEATVIDQTQHAEQTSAGLPVAAQPILIEAVAESGHLRPGVENIIYILTAYPDGAPAPTELEIQAGQDAPQALATNEYGLAEFRFSPQPGETSLIINAHDKQGFSATRLMTLAAEAGPDHVLLRADRAAYVVGETMNLVALSPVNAGSIYLDIVKEGQTLSTRSAPLENGRASFAVDLSPDLYGSLELHAYKVLLDGSLVRDTRLVVVDEPRDLNIAISADRESYRPGESAAINFQTTATASNAPVQTALGLAVVDESVFALQRQDPGFAKLYFMLEAELMTPFYQLQGFTLPAAYSPDQAQLREAQDTSAQAAWADAPASGLALQANSRPEKMEALRQRQDQGFQALITVTIIAMSLIPLLIWLAVILALAGSGLIKRSLIGLAKVSAMLLVLYAALYGLVTFLSNISYNFYWFIQAEESWLFLLGGLFVLALLGLAVYAWRRRDEAAKFICLLSAGWLALLYLVILAADQGSEPDESLAIWLALAFLLLPGAYLLYGQKLWGQARRLPGWLATVMGGVTALPALLIPLFFTMSMGGAALGGVAAPAPMMEMARDASLASGLMALEEQGSLDEIGQAEADSAGPAAAPRLRQFFPETLYWQPELLTDQNGQARLELPMADSITTWRLTALASSQDGRLGFATQGLRVFQDFFVDIDLPVALTQGDEISIPVGVFNYLPEAQQVRLAVEPENWFELLGQAEQSLTIAPNEVDVVYFPIRVREFGRRGFQVTARGDKMSDAIRREVAVLPNGQEVRLTESNWLREDKVLSLNIPPDITPRTAQVEVKIYTGVLAQVVEGLEKILRLPHG